MTKLFKGMELKSSKTGRIYTIISIDEDNNEIHLSGEENKEADTQYLNKIIEALESGYYEEVKAEVKIYTYKDVRSAVTNKDLPLLKEMRNNTNDKRAKAYYTRQINKIEKELNNIKEV